MSTIAIYETAAAIAAPIVMHYREDLTRHDCAAFAAAGPGDAFLWAPRECGTQLVSVPKAPAAGAAGQTLYEYAKATRGALEWFDASVNVFGAMQWYLIAADGDGRGRIRPIQTSAARDLVASTMARAETAWRRAHN